MTYANRLVSEATLQLLDECGDRNHVDVIRESGHMTLATMARQPATIAAVNKAREFVDKITWANLNRPSAKLNDTQRTVAKLVWDTLPGYTCLMDAVSILARL